jgi:hypothetical protein
MGEGLQAIIVLIVVGVGLLMTGFHLMKRKSFIENIPTSKIRSIAMGLVEVKGKAIMDTYLKSPFLHKDCVFWKYTVEKYHSSKNSSGWRVIRKGQSSETFYVKDDTGKVLVDPARAELYLNRDLRVTSLNKLSEEGKTFLISSGVSTSFFSGKKRFTEYAIEAQNNVYIMGTAMKNGFAGTTNTDSIVIKRNKANFMVISDKKENNLLKTLKWQTWGSLLGGACSLGLGIIIIIVNIT